MSRISPVPMAANDGRLHPLDLETAARRVPAGDPRLIRELAELLVAECATRRAELQEALKRHHAKDLERAAHTLGGATDVFGARAVVESARTIERLARACDFRRARIEFQTLSRELGHLERALSNFLCDTDAPPNKR